MHPQIHTYLDPADYSTEAVAAARAGQPAELNSDLKIVRLACALEDNDLQASQDMLTLLEKDELAGNALFKARTGALFVAARQGDQNAFDRALALWMTGRDMWPGNWIDEVLNAPELLPMLPTLHPALVKQREAAKQTLSKAQLGFVKDLGFTIMRAVRDNLEYLRAVEPKGTMADLSDRYRLIAVDLDLCEATLQGRNGLPDLIVALDEKGAYRGSFIAH
jgi:hypothetical protein